MSACESCTKGSHRIGKSRLVHGDDIHVSLADDQVILSGLSGNVQAVKVTALVKNFRLRRVQIFGFCIAHNTSAKSDHPVIHIHNGKHDTVPELVVHAISLIRGKKPGFFQNGIRISFSLQIPVQAVCIFAGIAQAKTLDGIV